jgi:hypothetical protein
MSIEIKDAVSAIVFRKAERLDEGNRKQAKEILKDLGIKDTKDTVDAFILGCLDAMVYDVGHSLSFQYYARKAYRKKLIKQYWTSKKKK